MASLARYCLRLAAVPMASDAVGILFQCTGGMMMAIGAFLGQLDMLGMVEVEWLIKFALTVQGDHVRNGYPTTDTRQTGQQQ